MSLANIKETLLQEVHILPIDYCPDVLHYIEALKAQRHCSLPETMLLSEVALSRDWDTPEEDKAWANL